MLPADLQSPMNYKDLDERLEFIRRAERLKDTLRSGYTTNGRTESVADHTWRLTLLVITFADLLPSLDLLRLLKICILHDLGEAVDGDIPAPSQIGMESKSDKERNDFMMLLDGLPAHVSSEFLALWDEYEYLQSTEAQAAKALDKIWSPLGGRMFRWRTYAKGWIKRHRFRENSVS